MSLLFFPSRRRHTRCALVTGVQTCALPISGMALSRRHEADRTVAVLMVIPALELAYPCSGCPKIIERLTRVCWPVFQRLEKRLREWVVVADSRATLGRSHAQSLQGRQHGGSLHRAAIIRMQYDLVRS